MAAYIPPDVIVFSMIASNAVGASNMHAFRQVCKAWNDALVKNEDAIVSQMIPSAIAEHVMGSCIRIPVLVNFLTDAPGVYQGHTPTSCLKPFVKLVVHRMPETKDELVRTLDTLLALDDHVLALYPSTKPTNLSRWVRTAIVSFLEDILVNGIHETVLCPSCKDKFLAYLPNLCDMYVRTTAESASREKVARKFYAYMSNIFVLTTMM